MQRPPIRLPITDARCRPEANVCHRRESCARAQVAPEIGRPLVDHSTPAGSTSCGYWLDAAVDARAGA